MISGVHICIHQVREPASLVAIREVDRTRVWTRKNVRTIESHSIYLCKFNCPGDVWFTRYTNHSGNSQTPTLRGMGCTGLFEPYCHTHLARQLNYSQQGQDVAALLILRRERRLLFHAPKERAFRRAQSEPRSDRSGGMTRNKKRDLHRFQEDSFDWSLFLCLMKSRNAPLLNRYV